VSTARLTGHARPRRRHQGPRCLLGRRLLALGGLIVYLVAAWALPLGHLLLHHHHAHDHALGGTHWHAPSLAAPTDPTVEDVHADFDADLVALELSDAGHLGVMEVDCALADYTLVRCDDPGAASHSFGDELLARLPHRHRAPETSVPFDPHHGDGSLSHLAVALVGTSLYLLPPPVRPLLGPAASPLPTGADTMPEWRPGARAPPSPPFAA
jgi:hypothetical protein